MNITVTFEDEALGSVSELVIRNGRLLLDGEPLADYLHDDTILAIKQRADKLGELVVDKCTGVVSGP